MLLYLLPRGSTYKSHLFDSFWHSTWIEINGEYSGPNSPAKILNPILMLGFCCVFVKNRWIYLFLFKPPRTKDILSRIFTVVLLEITISLQVLYLHFLAPSHEPTAGSCHSHFHYLSWQQTFFFFFLFYLVCERNIFVL